MSDLKNDLSELSKDLVRMQVANVLKKANVKDDPGLIRQVSEEQKLEIKNLTERLTSLVDNYVSRQTNPTQQAGGQAQESPLRQYLRKKSEMRSDNG